MQDFFFEFTLVLARLRFKPALVSFGIPQEDQAVVVKVPGNHLPDVIGQTAFSQTDFA
jgi:hypothetical protein